MSRKRTIAIAFLATGAAKAIGALVQLAVLPIAAKALGAESLGLLFTLAALASFPSVAMAGFSPAASALIAEAMATKEYGKVGVLFWSLQCCAAVSGVLLSTLACLALILFDLPGATEANMPFAFLLFLMINFIAAPIEGTRAAFGHSHYNSSFAILGSTVTLSLAILAAEGAGATYFFVAIYAVPVFSQFLNLMLFIVQYRKNIGMPRFDLAVSKDIWKILSNSMQAHMGIVTYLHGGVLILASTLGTAPVAIVGVFVRIGVLVHSMLLSLFVPVLPTITSAVARSDRDWIKKSVRNLWLMAGLVLFVQAAITAALGEWISLKFLDHGPTQDAGAFFIAMAVFVFCYSTTHLLFLSRVSLVSVEIKGEKMLLGAFVGLVAGLITTSNNVGIFLAVQAVSLGSFATLFYARQTARHVFGE